MPLNLDVTHEEVARFCERWNVAELALFGSALRGSFRPDSDVDLLVTFAPGVRPKLSDLTRMEDELRLIFGRPADLVDRRSVEQSENYIRRKHVLDSIERLYVA